MTDERRIVVVGGGNMGRAIIGGLLATGYDKSRFKVVEPAAAAREILDAELGIASTGALDRVEPADIVLLAVKPQIMKEVVVDLSARAAPHCPLLISIAAGITTTQLVRWFGRVTPVVRVMPNTPALVRRGAAALYATSEADADDRAAAQSILAAVGLAEWVDEEALLDGVTALSGSGPAYFFLFIELLAKVGAELGLEPQLAEQLAKETALGAALLACESDHSPSTLREQVTSPGGTTERALNILNTGNLEQLVREALTGAAQRSQELAAQSEATS